MWTGIFVISNFYLKATRRNCPIFAMALTWFIDHAFGRYYFACTPTHWMYGIGLKLNSLRELYSAHALWCVYVESLVHIWAFWSGKKAYFLWWSTAASQQVCVILNLCGVINQLWSTNCREIAFTVFAVRPGGEMHLMRVVYCDGRPPLSLITHKNVNTFFLRHCILYIRLGYVYSCWKCPVFRTSHTPSALSLINVFAITKLPVSCIFQYFSDPDWCMREDRAPNPDDAVRLSRYLAVAMNQKLMQAVQAGACYSRRIGVSGYPSYTRGSQDQATERIDSGRLGIY